MTTMQRRRPRRARPAFEPQPLNITPYPPLERSEEPASLSWAYQRANEVLLAYNLLNVEVVWTTAVRFSGKYRTREAITEVRTDRWGDEHVVVVHPAVREIRMSRPYVQAAKRRNVDEMIKHEAAHALAGVAAGHGEYWWRQYRAMGGCEGVKETGEVQIPASAHRRFTGWVGTCQTQDGEPCTFHRRTLKAGVRNGTCALHHKAITWVNNA